MRECLRLCRRATVQRARPRPGRGQRSSKRRAMLAPASFSGAGPASVDRIIMALLHFKRASTTHALTGTSWLDRGKAFQKVQSCRVGTPPQENWLTTRDDRTRRQDWAEGRLSVKSSLQKKHRRAHQRRAKKWVRQRQRRAPRARLSALAHIQKKPNPTLANSLAEKKTLTR